jgi:tRNA-splicing ligase RtcB
MKKHLIQLTKGITVEDNALSQYMEIFKEDAILKGAIMPDIHHGYTVPIGSVFDANKLLTTAIGADIGCGVDVYKTELTLIDIEEYKEKIKNELVKIIPAESHKQPQLLPNHLETVI